MIRNWRAAAGAFAAGLAGAITLAAPAAADVTVTPAVAPKGGPAALVFTVPEERPGAHTKKVELLVPEATPIGEVYPMSVVGWAPATTSRKLDKPIELIHGSPSKDVVDKVTWIRVGKAPANPVPAALLKVSMGPMPQAEQIAFTIVQTYSDGTVVRWTDAPNADGTPSKKAAPVVKLMDVSNATAPQAGQQPASSSSAGAADKSDGGGPPWFLLAGLLVALAFVVEGWVLMSVGRRGPIGAARSSAA